MLVSERTARATRGFRFGEPATVDVRAKARPLRAFELLGAEPAPARGVPGLRAPMVGRDRELELLTALYDRVADEGAPHLVTVYGDPGVGKSRLVGEFVRRADARQPPASLLQGRCVPYGEGITYWPLAEILKSVAGALDSDPADVVLDKIRRTCLGLLTPELTPDPVRATAALAYTVGVEDPDVEVRRWAPRQVRLETHAAWRSFFSALAASFPLTYAAALPTFSFTGAGTTLPPWRLAASVRCSTQSNTGFIFFAMAGSS